MSTQKLPRPHVFTPPDLTLITLDSFGRRVKKPLVGRYGSELWGRTYDPQLFGFPADTRGLTCVSYTHPALYESQEPRHFYCLGKAFLHTPDVFSEPFGVSLATVRAVTDLIEKRQPVNARDIETRIRHYVNETDVTHGFRIDEDDTLAAALYKLAEAIQKCQASK